MKSAKHTKYEGNPRHAKGLQILSEREYKRLAKRAASMALAAAMAASTLCAPALAVEYDAANGTVHTENIGDIIFSWQENLEALWNQNNKYDHSIGGSATTPEDQLKGPDNTINITGNTNDQVLNVGSGTTGLDITVDGVTAEVEGDNVIKVEDGTQVGVTIKDSELTSTGGDAAISIDGDSVMDIEGSTIKGGGKEHAAIEAKGNSKVALDNSTVTGNGTGVQVQENATLIIGGAEITPGTLILSPVIPEEPEEDSMSVIVGNSVTVEEVPETAIDVSGTGIVAEDNASVIVNEGTTALVVGSDVTVAVPVDNQTVTLTGTGIGVDLQDNASLTVEGEMESYGEQVYLNNKDLADVKNQTTNNTGVNAADSSSVNVAETGTLYAQDSASGKSSTVYAESSTLSGTRYVEDGENNFVKVYTSYLYEYDEASGQYKKVNKTSSSATHYRSRSEINGEYVYYSIADYPLYSTTSSKPTLSDTSTGAGLQVKDNAQANISGNAVTQMATLEDNALLKVVDEGTLAVNTLTIAENYSNPIHLEGMLYAEKVAEQTEQGTDEFEGEALINWFGDEKNVLLSGTGVRYATMVGDKMQVYYQIGEGNHDKEVTIDLGKMIVGTRSAHDAVAGDFEMPGSVYNYDLRFVNKSGHEYIYKDQSFTIAPSAEGIQSLPARCPNEAIMALYGVSEENDLSLEDLINVEAKLQEEGYASLEEYYLDYLNEHYNKNYSSLYAARNDTDLIGMVNSFRNAQYTITRQEYELLNQQLKDSGCTGVLYIYSETPDGMLTVQLKETELELDALGRFYNSCLGIGFGGYGSTAQANPSGGELYGQYNHLGDYNYDESVYAENEVVFKNAFGTTENPLSDDLNFQAYFLLDGPKTNNEYQCFSFGWNNTITLSRIDPDPVPPTDPEDPTPTPDPDPEEPTLILTPVPEEEEVPEEETPLAPAPVEEIPEEETPLVDAPVIDESLEEIGEEDVPLASAPKTGDESGAFGLMAVLSGMALAVMSFFGKKKEQ